MPAFHLHYPMLAKSVYKEAVVKVVARKIEKKIMAYT